MTLVREFHEAFELTAPTSPTLPTDDLVRLRLRLIAEEYEEVREEVTHFLYAATLDAKIAAIQRLLKELADLRYVVEGVGVVLGVDFDQIYREVHESNMSKLDKDGRPIHDAAGKVMKGPDYAPPDVEGFFPGIIEGRAESDEVL